MSCSAMAEEGPALVPVRDGTRRLFRGLVGDNDSCLELSGPVVGCDVAGWSGLVLSMRFDIVRIQLQVDGAKQATCCLIAFQPLGWTLNTADF